MVIFIKVRHESKKNNEVRSRISLNKRRSFTKKHLIRVVYIDVTGDEISTNALKLTFSSVRSDDKSRCEIVYTRFNFLSGFHILYRSHCALEEHKDSGDHLNQLTKLYLSFTYAHYKFKM